MDSHMDFQGLLPLLQQKREDVLSKSKWSVLNLASPLILLPCVIRAEKLVHTLLGHGLTIEKICDNNPALHSKMLESVAVGSVEYVRQAKHGTQIVITSTDPTTVGQLNQQLLSLGIESGDIYLLEDLITSAPEDLRRELHRQYMAFFDLTPEYNDQREIQKASAPILQLMDELRDQRSKDVLLSLLAARYFDDFRLLSHVVEKTHYFAEFFPIRQNEVFIDAGAYIGDTAGEFACRAQGHAYTIHCFEPSPAIYRKLCKTVSDDGGVICHNSGLGNRDEVLAFTSTVGGTGKVDVNGDTKIQMVLGDSLNLKPTWVKADVEGGEMALLQGFQKAIKQYKPRLSICVYHNSYDLWEIPRYIKSLVPDYHFFLRQHCKNTTETVLHAAVPGNYTL